jgi:hypothetical protein
MLSWPGLIVAAFAAACFVGTATPQTPRPSDPLAAAPRELKGLAAWQVLAGNTIVGTVEGRAFAEFYDRDGTVKLRVAGKLAVGRWTVNGDQVCFEYPGDPRECLRPVVVDGSEVTWFNAQGGIDNRGTLRPGNPENL